jgi:hypothetical protein
MCLSASSTLASITETGRGNARSDHHSFEQNRRRHRLPQVPEVRGRKAARRLWVAPHGGQRPKRRRPCQEPVLVPPLPVASQLEVGDKHSKAERLPCVPADAVERSGARLDALRGATVAAVQLDAPSAPESSAACANRDDHSQVRIRSLPAMPCACTRSTATTIDERSARMPSRTSSFGVAFSLRKTLREVTEYKTTPLLVGPGSTA